MSSPIPDPRLEDEIKAMLRRRALDIDPEPPSWRELAQRNGAVVISLRTGTPVDPDSDEAGRRKGRPGRQWFRPVLAAAITLVLVMAAALLVGSAGPSGDDVAQGPIDVPAAGNRDFLPSDAAAFFPAVPGGERLPAEDWITDPSDAARAYLAQVGLPVDEARFRIEDAVRQSVVDADDRRSVVETANVSWSVRPDADPNDRPITNGVVFLRNTEQGGRNTWLVVGVMTVNLRLDDIKRGENVLTFEVDRTADASGLTDPARVLVDGMPVEQVGVGEVRVIEVHRPPDEGVLLQVEHVLDGRVVSVTATAVPSIDILTGAVDGPKIVVPERNPAATVPPIPAEPDAADVPAAFESGAAGGSGGQVVVQSGAADGRS
jgi:hypothetical protein